MHPCTLAPIAIRTHRSAHPCSKEGSLRESPFDGPAEAGPSLSPDPLVIIWRAEHQLVNIKCLMPGSHGSFRLTSIQSTGMDATSTATVTAARAGMDIEYNVPASVLPPNSARP